MQTIFVRRRWPSWLVVISLAFIGLSGCDKQASRLATEHGLRWGDSSQGLPYFDTAIELDPENTLAYAQRGYIRANIGPYDLAAKDLQRAVELDPEGVYHYEAYNGLAWLLATCPEERIRNGPEAVKLAKQACQFCNYENEDILDTLAAAYAESGDFKLAVEWQEKAIALAKPYKLGDFNFRLRLYKKGISYFIGEAEFRPRD